MEEKKDSSFLHLRCFFLEKTQVISHVSPLEHKCWGSDFKIIACQLQDTHNLM